MEPDASARHDRVVQVALVERFNPLAYRQTVALRAMSTARNALVVNPKAWAHRLVDTLAPCSPSTGSTRSSRPSDAENPLWYNAAGRPVNHEAVKV